MLKIIERWTVKRKDRGTRGRCLGECLCGDVSEYDYSNITNGNTTKCRDCANKSRSKLHTTHGMSNCTKEEGGKLLYTWKAMISRCSNEKNKRFSRYGGRGISVCKRWLESFDRFMLDMGEPPTNEHSIDRIDNNGNYEPSNCKWSTMEEQSNNKSNNRFIEHDGERLTLAQWSRKTGIHQETIASRIDRYGWSIAQALVRDKFKYSIEGKPYKTLGEIASLLSMSTSGVNGRILSDNYPDWQKIPT